MKSDQYIDSTEREGLRLIEAASIDPSAEVGACPGWDVARLLGHMGQVYGWAAAIIASPGVDRPDVRFSRRPDDGLAQWVTENLEALVQLQRATPADQPTWTWGKTQTAGWFERRMAQETVVHRWDVEAAVGVITPIDAELALDGIDELIEVGLLTSSNPDSESSFPVGSLHLHCTDAAGEWLLRSDGSTLEVTKQHAKGDIAVRASAADLFLYLWGRDRTRLDLEIFGDDDLADAWAALAP